MAHTTHRLFSRETEVSVDIAASAERVWAVLTDLEQWPAWTSTVLSVEGVIGMGQRVKLRSSLSPTRTFSLVVKEVLPPRRLAWGDAMGRRTYELHPGGVTTTFRMHERIGGPFFPLFARMIPPFDAAFDQFARDLKARSELA